MKNKSTIIGLVIGAIVVVGALVAISGSSMKSNGSTSTTVDGVSIKDPISTNVVSIQNYMYMPAAIKVKVGTTVTWTNKDAVEHSVTASTASQYAPNGGLFGQNKTFSYTFKKAGTYPLYCILHPYMHSVIIVTN